MLTWVSSRALRRTWRSLRLNAFGMIPQRAFNRKDREEGAKHAKKIETVGADGGYNQAKLTLKETDFGLSIFCAY